MKMYLKASSKLYLPTYHCANLLRSNLSAAISSLVFSLTLSSPGSGFWSCSCPPIGTSDPALAPDVVEDDDDDDVVVDFDDVVVAGLTFADDVIVDAVDVVVATVSLSPLSSSLSWIGSSMKIGISVRVVMPLTPSTPDTDNVSWSPTCNKKLLLFLALLLFVGPENIHSLWGQSFDSLDGSPPVWLVWIQS